MSDIKLPNHFGHVVGSCDYDAFCGKKLKDVIEAVRESDVKKTIKISGICWINGAVFNAELIGLHEFNGYKGNLVSIEECSVIYTTERTEYIEIVIAISETKSAWE